MDINKDIKKDLSVQKSTDIIESPPPPYSSITGSQTLDVHYQGWGTHIVITDSAGQELFVSRTKGSSTRLEIFDRNKQVIGSSKSNDFTAKSTVEMNTGASFEIHNSRGILGGSPKYPSQAFGGEMVWRNKAMSSKIIYDLFDSRGKELAKFQSNQRTQIGKLEIGDITGEDRMNELAVTLLTLLHRKLRCIQAAVIAAIV